VDWSAPDYHPVVLERMERLKRLRGLDPDQKALVMRHYALNPADWVDDWGTTFDPRQVEQGMPASRPMVLFPRQREFIQFMHGCNVDREDGVIEKTREVGISWCAIHYAVHAWIFKPGSVVGVGSYEDQRVDKLGVMDSLLEKARHVLRNLPIEFLPAGFQDKEHLLHKRLVNPQNGSQIIGETGDTIGRGGRATFYIIDEYAFLKHPDLVDSSLSNTTECRIYISTAYGLGSFYKKTQNPVYRQFRFEWRQDPRKSEKWYQKFLAKYGPEITAREVDIDHHASVENLVVEARWLEASQKLLDALIKKGVDVPPRNSYSRGVGGLDVGGGAAPSVFIARHGPYVGTPIPWKSDDGNTTITAEKALRYARRQRTEFLHFDAPAVGKGVASTLRLSDPKDRVMDPIPLEEPGGPPLNETPEQRARREVEAMFAGSQPEDAPRAIMGEQLVKARGIQTGNPANSWVRWPDGRTSRQSFANLKAEIWWVLRHRFQASYELWLWATDQDGGVQHDLDEVLFLPAGCEQLKKELVGPTWHEKPNGKVAIESKDDLKKRGVASPDEADTLALTFVPIPPVSGGHTLEGYF